MVERWRYVALGLLAALGVLVLIFQLLPYTASVDKDFAQEYVLARAIRAGADPYQSVHDLGAQFVTTQGYFDKPHPTPHPPTVGLLALPLGFMDYGAAARVWF